MNRPKILAAVTALLAIAVCLSVWLCQRKKPAGNSGIFEGQVVYVGTYGSGLYRYIFVPSDGSFTFLGKADVANPSYIALGEENDRDGIYDVYAVSENGGDSGIYSFADDIMLSMTGSNSDIGRDPCFLLFDREGHTLMTAEYGSGSLSVFRVDEDGAVAELLQRLEFKGSGPVKTRQESSHIHQLKFLPAEDGASCRYLLATDLGADRIRVMKVSDHMDGPVLECRYHSPVLTCLPDADILCGEGSGPRHMAVDAGRHRLYCLTELSGELLVFSYSFDGDGNPVFELDSRLLADENRAGGSADIRIHPSGRFLYTSHRLKKDGISVFSVADDGSVIKTGYCRTGKHPRNFAITPDGTAMLVACRDDRTVEVYGIDPDSGALTYSGTKLRFAEDMPSCVVIAE